MTANLRQKMTALGGQLGTGIGSRITQSVAGFSALGYVGGIAIKILTGILMMIAIFIIIILIPGFPVVLIFILAYYASRDKIWTLRTL